MRDCSVARKWIGLSAVWLLVTILVTLRTFLNVALVAGGKPVQKRVKSSGLMRLACDAHPFMQGFVMVIDHDFVATTDAPGWFSIAGVPPGKQEISLWLETLGALTKHVTVPPHGELSVTFQYP